MTFINLTPHPINIIDGETLPKCEVPPRVSEEEELLFLVDSLPIYQKSFGAVENLPAPKADTYYIVSAMIASACPKRDDLLVPRVVRDENGRIIGCDGFYRIG